MSLFPTLTHLLRVHSAAFSAAALCLACATPSGHTQPASSNPVAAPTPSHTTNGPATPLSSGPDTPTVTASQFNSIRKGMSFAELIELLGPPSRDLCSGRVCLEWRCKDGRRLVAVGGGSTPPELSFE